ncbi:MAG TPA: class I tRNA ligase family protein, partial [Thermoanaerobaculia bacterium]|nr:class I tRNA ligase family protein [Thermoanaerobaculia bacterium]
GSEEGLESPAGYLAAAPGHPEIEDLLAGRPAARPVREFLERLRSEPLGRARRQREDQEASERGLEGVDTGIRVIDPLTGAVLPVFVARFVDPHFATGIEIGRPGASERDAEFARLHGIRPPERSSAGPRHGGVRNVTHFRVRDWLVSRQRSWGTPIPILYCETCGVVPVPDRDLPVLLPKALAEEPPGRYGLRNYPEFVHASCPRCGRDARRETDTLDCYFDVVWCFLACSTRLDDSFAFRAEDFAPWMPVDWFHNGLDSFFYAHLYRFLGRVLFDMKILAHPEPVRRYSGHDAVLSAGRKMSKHHGNVVAPDIILDQVGADVLRVHILWAARPLKSMEWSDTHLERARRFLETVWDLVGERAGLVREHGAGEPPAKGSARSQSLERLLARTVERVTVFLEDYRYNACLEEINTFVKTLAGFARGLGADPVDRAAFARSARLLVLLLSPFAPHLSEELWEQIGGEGLAATAPWPRVERTHTAGKPRRPEPRRSVPAPVAEP